MARLTLLLKHSMFRFTGFVHLGGSILAFLHIPIFILAELHDYFSRHKKKVRSNSDMDKNISAIAKEDIYPSASTEVKSL